MPGPVAPLESRRLMAAGGLGINLDGRLDYVDVMKESGAWTKTDGTPVATDANGWPLADAQVTVLDFRLNQPWNGPDPGAVQPDIGGTYHLSFQGQATVAPPFYAQNYQVQNQAYNAATNTTTADLFVYHNVDPFLAMTFTRTVNPASSDGAGVANVRLVQPGYAADTTQVFTDNYINALGPFGTIRYLNVDGANVPAATPYAGFQPYTTPTFSLAAGTHTITIQGLNTVGDATAFVDAVSMVNTGGQVLSGAIRGGAVPLSDAGFESPAVPSSGFVYGPAGTAWSYAGGSGITTNPSPFTWFNAPAPEGKQMAFLQNQGSVSQAVTGLASGSYTISLSAQQRGNYGAIQSLEVLVDGRSVGRFTLGVGGVTPLEWSQRKLPTASSQAAGPGAAGVSWEDMIALANATNTDMWINIPGAASDGYVAQLAGLIKNGDTVGGVHYAGLKSNLKVYLEYSNEVWGGIYGPFADNFQAALQEVAAGNSTLNADGNGDVYTWAQRRYFERTMQVTTIFRGVLGADPTYGKIRPVLTAQDGNYYYYLLFLPWFAQNYGAPGRYFYGLSTTNYVNPTDYSSVDKLIGSIAAQVPNQTAIATHFTALANYYGLHSLAYEGGPSTVGAPNAAGAQVALAASRDPRMEGLVVQFYQAWYAGGTELAATFDGPYGSNDVNYQYALAEMAQAADPAASARYRGFVDLSRAVALPLTAGAAVDAAGVTSLSTAGDSLGQGFTSAGPGQTNYWTIAAAQAGFYNLDLQTAPGTTGGRVVVSLSDTNTLGTYDLGSAATHSLGVLALHAGLNTLALTTLGSFTPTALTLSPSPTLADPGFESLPQVPGYFGFTYAPTGTPWTFAGSAGVAGNGSGFTQLNPMAPSGAQVAFLKNQGSIAQTVAGLATGNYTVSFDAARRAGFDVGTFRVLVDGAAVAEFGPASTAYQHLATNPFSLTAGSHTIQFVGLPAANGGDAADLLDGIALTPVVTAAPALGDAGFESLPQASGYNGFTYAPTGSAWTFAGSAGVAGNGSGFTQLNPAAPSGTQVAFLKDQGSISQAVALATAGSFQVSFDAARRAGYDVGTFQVLVDGAVVGRFRPANTSYQHLATNVFGLSAGSHTIQFVGLPAANGGDAADLLDGVALTPSATAAPLLGDAGFDLLPLIPGPSGVTPDPTGSPWTFAGPAGVAGDGSALTAHNPPAPSGTQVAFLQNQGTIAQAVAGLAAGNYTISFAAAALAGSAPGALRVLVDGVAVGQFAPTGTSYQRLVTAPFALAAGSHTIQFVGLPAASGGNATVLLDGVALTPGAAPALGDAGFESLPQASGYNGFTYAPTGSAWTFVGSAGVAGNGSGFTQLNPAAPSGTQVAFLQNQGTITQAVDVAAAGSFQVSFDAAVRAGYAMQTFRVLVDGAVVGQFRPASTSYQRLASAAFALSAGKHTITFQGLNASGDATAFLDNVSIDPTTS